MKDLKLVSGYDVLYGKVKQFVRDELFERAVDLEDANTLRNLSEPAASKTLVDTLKKAINSLTVQQKGDAEIRDYIKLRQTRPFIAKEQGYVVPKKSIFNKIIGDSSFELAFATFLENCDDIVSYAKNYMAVAFRLDYVNAAGEITNYHPDFFVKLSDSEVYVIETKGREDLDVVPKFDRLTQWCDDINKAQSRVNYHVLYVDEDGFSTYRPRRFQQLVESFRNARPTLATDR
jgi:type III restriction enzyme